MNNKFQVAIMASTKTLEYFWSFQLINYSYKDFARATNWSINNKDSQEKGLAP